MSYNKKYKFAYVEQNNRFTTNYFEVKGFFSWRLWVMCTFSPNFSVIVFFLLHPLLLLCYLFLSFFSISLSHASSLYEPDLIVWWTLGASTEKKLLVTYGLNLFSRNGFFSRVLLIDIFFSFLLLIHGIYSTIFVLYMCILFDCSQWMQKLQSVLFYY